MVVGYFLVPKNKIEEITSFFKSNEEMLKGKWELVSMVNYSNGEEHKKVKRSKQMNCLLGSNSKPKYYIFSKFNEIIWDTYPVRNIYNRNADTYELVKNKILLKSGKVFYVEKLTNSEMVLREELVINYYDKSKTHPKTYYIWTLEKCKGNE